MIAAPFVVLTGNDGVRRVGVLRGVTCDGVPVWRFAAEAESLFEADQPWRARRQGRVFRPDLDAYDTWFGHHW